MRSSALTRSMVLLDRSTDTDDGPAFTFPPVDAADRVAAPLVVLGWERWRDMGEPERITVTIEPGDRLNDRG